VFRVKGERNTLHVTRRKTLIEMKWVCFISIKTVPKVAVKAANFSEKPSGRFSFQLIWNTPK
jgi:hypothetical protein